ncbi:MAG: MFS transporter [Deltaproteobacteria bacterium]|nr:MFS transporter [Deltaproteobacteria bacterium]
MGPFKYRDFRLLWFGWLFAAMGSWIHQLTSSWLILELTNSPFMLGLNGVFMSVPFLIMSLYGGALADRMDRRKLLVLAQCCLTLLAFIPAVLTYLEVIRVWHIYALSFISWTVAAFDAPARHAMIPSLVPREHLMRAIAVTSILRRVTALIGPLIGGFAISTVGIAGAFLTYALLHSMVLISVILIRSHPTELEHKGTSMARSIVDGLKEMQRHPVIFGILTLEAVHTFFGSYQELMPVFARSVLEVGPTGLGFLYASPGVGAFLATGVLILIGDVKKKGPVFMVTAFLQPVLVGCFALSPWMGFSMGVMMLVGLIDVVGGTLRNTMLQLSAQERMRGRVMAMNMMVHRGLGPMSGIQAGTLATFFGAPFALTTGVIIVLSYATFLFHRTPELRQYSEGRQRESLRPAATEPGAAT